MTILSTWVSVEEFVDAVNSGGFDEAYNYAQGVFEANGGDDGTLGEGWALAETNVGQLAFYLQDEFEVNEKLTVTAGIRMDMPLYFNTEEKICDWVRTTWIAMVLISRILSGTMKKVIRYNSIIWIYLKIRH